MNRSSRINCACSGAMVVVAGATRFSFWKFLLADGLAAIVSGGLFLYLGYYFGGKIQELNEHVHDAKKWMLIGAVGLVVVIVVVFWIKARRHRLHEIPSSPVEPVESAVPTATVAQQIEE